MKKFIFALPLMFLAFVFTSCLKSDQEQETVYNEVIATVTSADNYPSFLTDDGFTLKCTNEVEADTSHYLTVGERYYLRYALDDTTGHLPKNYPILLNSISKVTIKNIVNLEKDSVDRYENRGLQSVYFFGISGNYLNMIFNTYTSMAKTDAYEIIRIKKKEENLPQDTMPTIYLELRHNVSSISPVTYTPRLSSVVLTPLVTEFPMAKRFNINLTWSLYSNVEAQSYMFIYKPYLVNSSSISILKSYTAPAHLFPVTGGAVLPQSF